MKEGTREIFVDEANCPQGCIASEEDIIYTRTGTLGLVFTGMHGVLHNNCFKIKHDINKLNKSFLIYFLRNDSFVKTIIGLASRAAQPDITHKLFKAQEIHFPPLAEQQRIVERLDALSENIRKYEEIQRQIISECDALKQALLRKVFE
jgi:type I restriction enzyme S subunit